MSFWTIWGKLAKLVSKLEAIIDYLDSVLPRVADLISVIDSWEVSSEGSDGDLEA